MEKQLIDCIYAQLIQRSSTDIPCYLRGGKIGVFLFHALYSEVKRSAKARNMASSILTHSLKKEINSLSCSILKGRLGLSWGIQHLANKDIIELDEEVERFRASGIHDCMSLRLIAPIQITKEDQVFSSGIYMSRLKVPKNTLEQYTHNERMIILLDECERLLLHTIPNIYDPLDMSLTMLHSILFFLLQADKSGIYPFLTKKLLEYIPEIYKEIAYKGSCSDNYICLFFMNKSTESFQETGSHPSVVEFIADLGFYSLLYDTPQIFNSAFHLLCKNPVFTEQVKKQIQNNTLDTKTLCGLGYGLLNMEGGIS